MKDKEPEVLGLIIAKEGTWVGYKDLETYEWLANRYREIGNIEQAEHFQNEYNKLKQELNK